VSDLHTCYNIDTAITHLFGLRRIYIQIILILNNIFRLKRFPISFFGCLLTTAGCPRPEGAALVPISTKRYNIVIIIIINIINVTYRESFFLSVNKKLFSIHFCATSK